MYIRQRQTSIQLTQYLPDDRKFYISKPSLLDDRKFYLSQTGSYSLFQ